MNESLTPMTDEDPYVYFTWSDSYIHMTSTRANITGSSDFCQANGLKNCLVCDKKLDQRSKAFCLLCDGFLTNDGKCQNGAPEPPTPDPQKPNPGEGCATYYQELRCFQALHPQAFNYIILFQIENLPFNDRPHLEFRLSEIDKLHMVLRTATTLNQIKFNNIQPQFRSSTQENRRIIQATEASFPESCKIVLDPQVQYKNNKIKIYPQFDPRCSKDFSTFMKDTQNS